MSPFLPTRRRIFSSNLHFILDREALKGETSTHVQRHEEGEGDMDPVVIILATVGGLVGAAWIIDQLIEAFQKGQS